MSFKPEHEIYRRRLGRNLGLGLVLLTFVGLVFGLTVVKVSNLGGEQGLDLTPGAFAPPTGGATK
tara:strand:+ start:4459 stop:4653 length:195 start_codon:yes stop_codon:yes gene_type:complete